MSGGTACKCNEHSQPVSLRQWVITQYRQNQSAFNGYHVTPSDYSSIKCMACGAHWRTKARFVDLIRHATKEEILK